MSTPDNTDNILPGTSGPDSIDGLAGNDNIDGFGGNDTLVGGLGNDAIDGGDDNDEISGDQGSDTIQGGSGNDTIDGGTEGDSILGGTGDDSISGGDGNDTVTFVSSFDDDGDDFIDLGAGDDQAFDQSGANTILGGEGDDSVGVSRIALADGGDGNDTIRYGVDSFTGAASISGGAGDDQLIAWFTTAGIGVTVDGGDGNDSITGGSAAESLLGGADNDTISGATGNDTIDGGTGDDSIRGGNNDDSIRGGDGDDTIEGEAGDDTIDGGTDGTAAGDTAVFSGPLANYVFTNLGGGSVRVRDIVGSDGVDDVSNVENFQFSDQTVALGALVFGIDSVGGTTDDSLVGTVNTDFLDGDEGNDTIEGLDGSDLLIGGLGDDSIDGGAGNDRIDGGADNDTIDGGTEGDSILGGTGDDSISGGDGNDTVTFVSSFDDDGDDFIDLGAGDDQAFDQSGANTILGGEGDDSVGVSRIALADGGDGNDTIRYGVDSFTGAASISGGAGDDQLIAWFTTAGIGVTVDGGDGNDSITGGSAAESLLGGADNDTISGATGNDTIDGGTGDDSIRGGNNDDSIRGGDGDDTLLGEDGDDSIDGGLGSDTITGGRGNDTIDGGDVGNIAIFAGNRANYDITLTGVLGEATVSDTVGLDGVDEISNIAILRFQDEDVIIGTNPGLLFSGDANPNDFDGTEGDDTMTGLGGDDTLSGNGGNDLLNAGDGADSLDGGAGSDSITGDAGSDTIQGGSGNDTIDGGTEGDSILGGTGDDSISGGDGNDTVTFVSSFDDDGDDFIDLGAGDDQAFDQSGANTILGGEGDDSVGVSRIALADGGDGNDTIRYGVDSFTGAASISGGAGDDQLIAWFTTAGIGVTVDGGDGNDSITGGSAAESLLGGADNDTISGATGNDTIDGGTGDDSIRGGNNDDSIRGGDGDDTIEGEAGDDTIDGGTDGTAAGDTAVFSGPLANYVFTNLGGGSVRVRDIVGSDGVDDVSNVENFQFSDQTVALGALVFGIDSVGGTTDDSLVGTVNTDFLDGDEGNDTIEGLDGSDLLIGGLGDDSIDGGAGNDRIDGGADNDTIDGGTEGDSILGGTGDDSISGGDGNDTVTFVSSFDDDGDDFIDLGAGDDQAFDQSGANTILGGEGDDSVGVSRIALADGGDGNDTIRYGVDSFTGAASISGGAGDDQLIAWFTTAGIGVTVDGGDGNDSITGGSAAESLLGGADNDTISGATGNDTIDGGTGDDSIRGGNNDDSIRGGDGDDTIEGEAGDDTIDGGTETTTDGDIAVFNGPRADYAVVGDAAGLTVVDRVGTDGTDLITNVERLRFTDVDVIVATGLVGVNIEGTEFDDNGQSSNPGALFGTILNDTIDGLAGNDSIIGLSGIDRLIGGDGNDTIDGGSENDIVFAGNGDDSVIGGEGDDAIDMGDGTDIAKFSGNQADYDITGDRISVTVEDLDPALDGDDGTDVITGARILEFADGNVFLNAAPTPDAETVVTDEDTQIVIPLADLLDGDTDADGDPLSIVRVENPSNGTVFISGTNAFFTPNPDFNGTASFEYVVSDTFQEVNQTVTVTVNPVNDPPVAQDDADTTDEDTATSGNVLVDNGSGPDTDVDAGDTLTVTAVNGVAADVGTQVTLASGALLTLNSDGSYDYDPNGQFESLAVGDTATDSFSYTVSDSNGGTDTATVTLTINGVNDPPVAQDDADTTDEDTAISGNVLVDNGSGPDTDVDAGDTLTVTAVNGVAADVGTQVTLASGALLTLNSDGSYDYDPNGQFESLAVGDTATDSFSYTVSDSNGGTDTATVTLTINGVNDPPVAQDDADTTDEDTAISGNVLVDNGSGPDTDVDAGDTLTVTEVNGVAADVGTQVTLASGALLTLNSDGSYDYEPASGFSGPDSFTYTVSDDSGATDTATVTITVNAAANTPPVAQDDADTTDEDTATSGNVLVDNGSGPDTDVDAGDTLTVTAVNGVAADVGTQVTLASGALLTLNSDGSYDYDPNGQFESLAVGDTATDSFSYTVSDSNGGTDTATVTLTINGVNDPPVAQDDADTTDEDTAISGNVLVDNGSGPDTDVDAGDTLTVTAVNGVAADVGTQVTLASGALLTLNSDGSYDYDPNGQFESLAVGDTATDSFSYTVSDSNGATDTATVTITIDGVNDPPVAQDDADTTDEDTATSGNVLVDNGSGPDTDVDAGDTLTITEVNGVAADVGIQVTLASGALLTLNSDGSYDYDPNGQFESLAVGDTATDSFSYTVSDSNGATDTATVTITIDGVNDPPVAQDDADTTDEDTATSGNVLVDNGSGPDTDVDAGDTLTITEVNGVAADVGIQVTLASGALLTLNSDGSYDYDPNGQFESLAVGDTATDSFSYTVSDSNGGTDTATVTLTINGVNDPPVAQDDADTTDEDTAISGNVLVDNGSGPDTDVDAGDTLTVTAVNGVAADVGTQVTLASGALLTLNSDGSYDYEPASGFSGPDSFTYTVSDDSGATDTATVTITVNAAANTPPVAQDDADTTDEDTATSGNVLVDNGSGPDTDVDAGDTLTVTAVNGVAADVGTQVTLASGALLTLNSDGSYDYDPNGQFESLAVGDTATDSFSYTVSDSNGGTDTATVTLTINGVNDPPVAQDDADTTDEDTLVSGNVLVDNGSGPDTDVDAGDTLTITEVNGVAADVGIQVTLASGALLTLNSDGSYDYDPNGQFESLAVGQTATDSFSYTVSDSNGATDTATVTLTIDGVNDAPTLATTPFVSGDGSDAANAATSGKQLLLDFPATTDEFYWIDPDGPEDDAPFEAFVDASTSGGGWTLGVLSLDNDPAAAISISETTGTASLTTAHTRDLKELGVDADAEFRYVVSENGAVLFDGTYTGRFSDPTPTFDALIDTEGLNGTLDATFDFHGTNNYDLQIFVREVQTPVYEVLPQPQVGEVQELPDGDANENIATLQTSGQIVFQDVDIIDTHTATAVPRGAGYLGVLTLGAPTTTNATIFGEVDWTFSVSDADLAGLGEGETLTQIYDVSIDDGNGGVVTETVTITLIGAADVASPDDQVVETSGSVFLFVDGLTNQYTLLDGSSEIGITFEDGTPRTPDSNPDWLMIHAEDNADGGYDLLFQNTIDGSYGGWIVDAAGVRLSTFKVDDVRDVEPFYEADINGDGIQVVETSGSVSLFVDGLTNQYTLLDGSSEIGITFEDGTPRTPDSNPDWLMIHAEDNADGGYDLLFQNTIDGSYGGWIVDATGVRLSTFNVDDVRDVEPFYEADINRDDIQVVETKGSVFLFVDGLTNQYTLLDGSSEIGITFEDGTPRTPDSNPDWLMIHAEDNADGGYDLLFQNTIDGSYGGWIVDATGVRLSTFKVDDVRDVEPFYEADINGDGIQVVETSGSVFLFVDGLTNQYTLLDGSSEIGITFEDGTPRTPDSNPDWLMIHAEDNADGGYDLLFQNTIDGSYGGWIVDATGDRLSTFNVDDVRDVEPFYEADINRDDILGYETVA